MKSLLLALLCLYAGMVYGQPTPVAIKPMKDYQFAGDAGMLKSGVNCIVLSDRKQFEKIFGTTDRADTPQFAKEWMLVLLLPATKKEAKLDFRRISVKAGDFIEVYCNIETRIQPLTYSYYPISTCVIPKYPGIHKINFYHENNMRLLSVAEVGSKK